MQLIGIISFPKRETFSMGYFIEKQEWCDKMSHHLCYDVSCNIIYYQHIIPNRFVLANKILVYQNIEVLPQNDHIH